MSDEVTEAKRRRWVRQLGEAMGEVFRAEVPVGERLEAIDLFTRVLTAAARPCEFEPHEDSPRVIMHTHEAGVLCVECES